MSAYGYKRTLIGYGLEVRFGAESGLTFDILSMSAISQQRTSTHSF